jgi:hypothetical protein
MRIQIRAIFDLVVELQREGRAEEFVRHMEASPSPWVDVPIEQIEAFKAFFVENGFHEATAFGRSAAIADRHCPPGGHCPKAYTGP